MPERTNCSIHRPGLRFRFLGSTTATEKCLRHAIVHRPLLKTALLTALVVGTVLTAINQGNVLLDSRFPPVLYWKIPLTYSVPYCVATWSALRLSYVGRSSRAM
jgi:hypothetical protein